MDKRFVKIIDNEVNGIMFAVATSLSSVSLMALPVGVGTSYKVSDIAGLWIGKLASLNPTPENDNWLRGSCCSRLHRDKRRLSLSSRWRQFGEVHQESGAE